MSQPTQPVTDVTSTSWSGGTPQGESGWCFAAAEEMVQRGFGAAPSQVEIAHAALIGLGKIQDSDEAVDYLTGCMIIASQRDQDVASWSSVETHVVKDKGLYSLLKRRYGRPPLTGRIARRGNVPVAVDVKQTLDSGGLVMIGTQIHWKIVFGYARDVNGTVRYKVYNPWGTGSSATVDFTTMSSGIEETYYVTG